MHSSAFGCVRMHLDVFGCVPTLKVFRKVSEIWVEKYVFRNFCEVSEKLEAWDGLLERYRPALRRKCREGGLAIS